MSGTLIRLRGVSKVQTQYDFSRSSFMALLLLFFYGELPRGKYGGVCHVDAEKEQQCLAAGVGIAVRNSGLTSIVLLMYFCG